MEPSEETFNMNQTTVTVPAVTANLMAKTNAHLVQIKQEIHENNSEVEVTEGPVIEQEGGIQVSIDQFVDFHNEQVKSLKEELEYVTRTFDIMYKFKTLFDLVLEDYFQDDKLFKYKSLVEALEADLCTHIADDENKYQALINEVNTDIILNDVNELEFFEIDNPNDTNVDAVVNNIDNTSNARRFPGQSSAPLPECPACGFKARCRLKLEGHILDHKDNPLVVCNHENCEVTFALHELTQHEKDYHPEISMICEICNEKFESKTNLVQHYKLHISKKERLRCNYPGCDYSDIYPGRLDRHKKAEHNIEVTKQFKCEHEGCGRIFKDRPSYYTHSLIHKDRSLVYKHKCTFQNCNSVFKRRRTLAMHMSKHGYVKRKYTCMSGECRRTYAREKELMRHIEMYHRSSIKNEENNTEESVVNETIKAENGENDKEDPSTLDDSTDKLEPANKKLKKNAKITNNHDLSEDNDLESDSRDPKVFVLLKNSDSNPDSLEMIEGNLNDLNPEAILNGTECELCQTSYENTEELLAHLKERHHQYTLKEHRCDFQDCTFVTHFRSVLGKHKNEVHGGKYKCEICGKLSKDSGNHNRHRNIHKNIVYRCRMSDCDAVYKSPKAYYVHILTHSNEQPVYACDHPGCKYVTYYVNTLNVHKLTHSDVRNFFCPFPNCHKGFKRNGDLNKHVLHSHKGIKRPQKKRKSNNNDSQMRCSFENCDFSSKDVEQLSKHEEEHMATETVQEY